MTSENSPLQVGEWLADPGTNELRRGTRTVRIEPKSMDVLMLLARSAGRVVTRDELFAAAWPGAVVGDEALTQSINKLRRALGDDSRSPAYIETISKRGYRLVAPVGAPGGARSRRHRAGKGVAVGLSILAIAVGAWWWMDEPRQAAPVTDTAREPWVTVTVQPFQFIGNDPSQAYLAQGIGANVVASLSPVSTLRLIRHSTTSPVRARYIVSGSVQSAAGRLRVNVHLADSESGRYAWSETFERADGDVLQMQDDIARRMVEALPARVSDVERERIARRYTRSLEAYDRFLRAQAAFLARTAEGNAQARELYREAIAIDPAFARAYAGLAMTHALENRLPGGAAAEPSFARAFELARTAASIDPDIPQVYWAIAFVHAQGRRHDEAIASLERAIELDPSYADAYALLGGIRTYIGEPGKSVPLLRTAMRLHPDGGYLYLLLLGRAYFFQGDLEQALINLRAAAERNPADIETRVFLAAAALAANDVPAARWEANELRAIDPSFSVARWMEAYPMTHAAQRQRLEAILTQVLSLRES